jgi:hypothetical protein
MKLYLYCLSDFVESLFSSEFISLTGKGSTTHMTGMENVSPQFVEKSEDDRGTWLENF